MRPAAESAAAPSSATAMASSHMRMRARLPMLTQSDTAPMVQKCVRLPTAPKTKASANAPAVTSGSRLCGFSAPTRPLPRALALGDDREALLGARRGAAVRVLGDELFQRLLRALAVVHRVLRAR